MEVEKLSSAEGSKHESKGPRYFQEFQQHRINAGAGPGIGSAAAEKRGAEENLGIKSGEGDTAD